MTPALLEIQKLAVAYHVHRQECLAVLRGISLKIQAGQFVAVIGESGCGKSTLAQAVFRILPRAAHLASGNILYDGTDLLLLSRRELRNYLWRRLALVPQDPAASLNPLMTVGKQIMEPLRQHLQMDRRAARARALELLAMVQLTDTTRCFHAYPFEISSGMRQRAVIAMALACRPALLIADEPTAAIDALTQREILGLLFGLKRELGLTLLYITHDLGLLHGFADRVVVLHDGQVVEDRPALQVWQDPQHLYTKSLIAASRRTGVPLPGSPTNPTLP